MNRVKEVERINSKDLKLQLASDAAGNAGRWNVESSWHGQYKDSAYVYVGGLDVGLTEGDVAVVFSQLGEVVDVHLPRDKKTGKPRGFAFVGYEDQRSTVLAVDNFNVAACRSVARATMWSSGCEWSRSSVMSTARSSSRESSKPRL